jgi:phosphomannomutase
MPAWSFQLHTIPYQDNGLKIFSPSGQKLNDEMEVAISEDVALIGPALVSAFDRSTYELPEPRPELAGSLSTLSSESGSLELPGLID